MLLVALAGSAEARLLLTGERVAPAGHLQSLIDPAGSLTPMQALAADWQRIDAPAASFGYTSATLWVRVDVRGGTSGSAEWLLRTHIRFMRPGDAWLVRHDGTLEHLFHITASQPFGERTLPLRHMAGAFQLAPGEDATVLIRFRAGGTAAMPFEFVTPARLARDEVRAHIWMAAFLAVLATLVVVNLAHFLAVRSPAHLLYALQESVIALYVLHLEGFAFQYLWPQMPQWNAIASPVLGNLTVIAGLMFAASFLDTRRIWPLMHRVLLGLVALCALLVLLTPLVDIRLANQVSLVTALAATLMTVAAVRGARLGVTGAWYFIIAWAARALAVAPFVAATLGIGPARGNLGLTGLEVGILVQALLFSVGLAAQIRGVNQRLQDSQAALIASLQERLEEARQRMRLEAEMEAASSALQRRSHLLAATSHDVGQPLGALKLALRAVNSEGHASPALAGMEHTLTELQQLLGDALRQARVDDGELQAAPPRRLAVGRLLAESVAQFKARAAGAGISLRWHDTPLTATVRELALKRCLNNLVSNAIRHTRHGGVLLAARRRGDALRVEVWDTGEGIEPADLERLLSPYEKGAASDGHGLGLAIVRELCNDNGWTFSVRSRHGRGTLATITLPID